MTQKYKVRQNLMDETTGGESRHVSDFMGAPCDRPSFCDAKVCLTSLLPSVPLPRDCVAP
jgi:hypothetical protein